LYSAAGSQAYGLEQFYPAVGNITGFYLAGQTLTSTIVDLSTTASFSFQVGTVVQSGLTTTVSYSYPPPANITGILKTPTVYSSTENGASTVHVVYAVSDQFGIVRVCYFITSLFTDFFKPISLFFYVLLSKLLLDYSSQNRLFFLIIFIYLFIIILFIYLFFVLILCSHFFFL
jgi:hypothetical protein